MVHNISDFKEYFAYIETLPFYLKFNGKITIKNDVKVIAETSKALLIREKIQLDKQMYSIDPIWIPKSIIIKIIKKVSK